MAVWVISPSFTQRPAPKSIAFRRVAPGISLLHPAGFVYDLVLLNGAGGRTARRFGFNGWGGKYLMAGDEAITAKLLPKIG